MNNEEFKKWAETQLTYSTDNSLTPEDLDRNKTIKKAIELVQEHHELVQKRIENDEDNIPF